VAIFLLFSTINWLNGDFRVFDELTYGFVLTQFNTTGTTMRIRLTGWPVDGDFDEFDLRQFRVGGVYDVPTRLASLLIIAGYAELVSFGLHISEAADFGHIRFPKRKE
jgi:hypothetical protein